MLTVNTATEAAHIRLDRQETEYAGKSSVLGGGQVPYFFFCEDTVMRLQSHLCDSWNTTQKGLPFPTPSTVPDVATPRALFPGPCDQPLGR